MGALKICASVLKMALPARSSTDSKSLNQYWKEKQDEDEASSLTVKYGIQ